ncbi:unnamed protein product [Lota lota]
MNVSTGLKCLWKTQQPPQQQQQHVSAHAKGSQTGSIVRQRCGGGSIHSVPSHPSGQKHQRRDPGTAREAGSLGMQMEQKGDRRWRRTALADSLQNETPPQMADVTGSLQTDGARSRPLHLFVARRHDYLSDKQE